MAKELSMVFVVTDTAKLHTSEFFSPRKTGEKIDPGDCGVVFEGTPPVGVCRFVPHNAVSVFHSSPLAVGAKIAK
jgi:hypothetical protein